MDESFALDPNRILEDLAEDLSDEVAIQAERPALFDDRCEQFLFAREVAKERAGLALQPADLGNELPPYREIADDPAIDRVQLLAKLL
jgi:hypothetical protein